MVNVRIPRPSWNAKRNENYYYIELDGKYIYLMKVPIWNGKFASIGRWPIGFYGIQKK